MKTGLGMVDNEELIVDFKNRVVSTNCGDFYMDTDILFDELFELVDYIKKTEREMKEDKWN